LAKRAGRPLIIVESPTKARTLTRAFGRRYRVEASLGHLRDLPRSQLGVDVEKDFEPKYITVRGRGDVVRQLRKAARKAGRILLATDPDREGEAISWHLAHLLDIDPASPCRIVFREVTKEAVAEAIRQPRPIDMDLVDAQQARRVLDRLVGYGLSPLLWRKVRRGLSAGRVQSVAVKLITDREREIASFVPQEYWTVTATLRRSAEGGTTFTARFVGRFGAGKVEKVELPGAADADRVVEDSQRARWTVVGVKRRTRRRRPPAPFTTSTLQQEAAHRLGFSVRKTMAVAQQLYEGVELGDEGPVGLITYMRTDATRVAAGASEAARALIAQELGPEYLPSERTRHKAAGRAQEAHEAVRPTDPDRTPAAVRPYLDADQARLYRLVWERFLASEMAPAVYRTVTVELEASGWAYRSSGSHLEFPGFLAAAAWAGRGLEASGDGRQEDSGAGADGAGDRASGGGEDEGGLEDDVALVLTELEPGEELTLVDLVPQQHFTSPPPRYSEATLVKAMEELGIGRPSTYAPTIETILTRGYVERKDGRLVPTELGRVVTELLAAYFPDILDVEFTASLEEQLDRVEEGRLPWRKVVRRFYGPFAQALRAAEEEVGRVEVPEEETGIRCDDCGRPMVVKYGRYGRFLACSGFPECRQTRPYAVATGARCPKCGAEVVEKRTRKGRRFYGCIRYPECDFSVWSRPTDRRCPECGSFMVVVGRGDGQVTAAAGGDGEAGRPTGPDRDGPDGDGPARKGVLHLKCANEACGFRQSDRPQA
jgi:DNA topoisomerase-1